MPNTLAPPSREGWFMGCCQQGGPATHVLELLLEVGVGLRQVIVLDRVRGGHLPGPGNRG
jgi:hypothetical protein